MRMARVGAAAYSLTAGLLVLPIVLPILPVQTAEGYADAASSLRPSADGSNWVYKEYSLSLSGRLGWDEMVQTVSDVYRELPGEERSVAGIYAEWYSGAGAIDLLGPQYGLPHAVSGHLTYYLWGPGEYSWEVLIVVTSSYNKLASSFYQCRLEAIVLNDANPHMAGNNRVYVCKDPKKTPAEIWRTVRNYQ